MNININKYAHTQTSASNPKQVDNLLGSVGCSVLTLNQHSALSWTENYVAYQVWAQV